MSSLRLEGTWVVRVPRQAVYEIEVRSRVFRLFGSVLLKRIALRYWKRAVIDRIEGIVAAEQQGGGRPGKPL